MCTAHVTAQSSAMPRQPKADATLESGIERERVCSEAMSRSPLVLPLLLGIPRSCAAIDDCTEPLR